MRQLIIVTPTWKRKGRAPYMRRFIDVLKNQENLLWLVVEDGEECDSYLTELFEASGIRYRYWAVGPTSDKGNLQRNAALEHIVDSRIEGIVYNADDDNLYHPDLFGELRKVERIALLPVGNLGPSGVERPVVKSGRIESWDAGWQGRRYPVDMAGFAFNSSLLAEFERPLWKYKGRGGESEFLEMIGGLSVGFEFLCDNCTTCLVWHNHPFGRRNPWQELGAGEPVYGSEQVEMRIVAPYTKSHEDLARRFFESCRLCDVPVELVRIGGDDEDGSFQSPSWRKGIREKVLTIRERVSSCDGSILIVSDVDIQFFGPIRHLIEEALIHREMDMAFQAETDKEFSPYNAGFVAMRCNESVASLYDALCESDYESLGLMEQEWLNENLDKFDLIHDCLPRSFWAWSHGVHTLSHEIVLHHANCTPGNDSIAQKIRQLDYVKRALSGSRPVIDDELIT